MNKPHFITPTRSFQNTVTRLTLDTTGVRRGAQKKHVWKYALGSQENLKIPVSIFISGI